MGRVLMVCTLQCMVQWCFGLPYYDSEFYRKLCCFVKQGISQIRSSMLRMFAVISNIVYGDAVQYGIAIVQQGIHRKQEELLKLISQFLYTRLRNGTYYVIALYGQAGKMVSAKYLEKYLTFSHPLWYTKAPGQDEDQFRTG